MSTPTTSGATTAPASTPATAEAHAPTVAAPATEPTHYTKYEPPARKQKDFAPRQNVTTSSGRSNPGLSMLLSGVSDMPFHGIKHNEPTSVIPNFTGLYHVLTLMDTQMVHTKRFTDANSDWHPFVSQLYFGILAFYQTLKNQAIGSFISNEQILFVEYMDRQFKAEHLKLPGPMVIFFQSLAACAGPSENFGNYVFAIPSDLAITQNGFYAAPQNVHMHLPNIIMILDQLMRILQDIAPATAAPGPIAQATTDRVYLSIFGTAAANTADNRHLMYSPNARFDVQTTTSLLSGLASSSNVWRNTLPFNPNTGNSIYTSGTSNVRLSLDQILGFRGVTPTAHTRYDWFAQASRIMQPYCDFFKDSVSLGSVTTTGIGIIYIKTTYTNDSETKDTLLHDVTTRDVRYQNPGTSRYLVPPYANVYTTHRHNESYLDIVTEQAGILTQLHVDWDDVNDQSDNVGPNYDTVVAGPITDVLDTRMTATYNVGATIAPIVSGYYHTPSALKFE